MNLRQFRLSNNDEIVADIIEVVEEGDIVIRNVLKIFAAEDFENDVRYYSFKPWISFQDDLEKISVLNVGHIIIENEPSEVLLEHYLSALAQIKKATRKATFDIEELQRESQGMDDDELRDFLRDKIDNWVMMTDSGDGNVIAFRPSKDKMH